MHLIEAPDDAARAAALETLVARAAPLIEVILSRYTRAVGSPDDLRDLQATALLRLLRRLDDVPRGDKDPIASFDDFVAMLAFNTANDLLRDRFPQRTRLKNRIRYVLTQSRRMASWRSPGGIAAGFSGWRGSAAGDLPDAIDLPRDDVEAALVLLFEAAGAPLLIDDAVNAIAAAWGVVEPGVVPLETSMAEAPAAEAPADQRDMLVQLWSEIRALRPQQRAALLLNLRDRDSSAIEIFVSIGAATIEELAEALEITVEQLAAMWNSLPLDDNTIAARLGMTRQQVINLRRAARDRLARRLGVGDNSR
jgi:hypothetical protein